MADFGARLKHAWNAFTKPEEHTSWDLGTSYSVRPDRIRSYVSNERSIITAIYNRISIDAASIAIRPYNPRTDPYIPKSELERLRTG